MILTQVAGHLGSDPETRFTPNGQKVTTLRVATNIRRAGKEKTVWWRITLWGDRFDRKLQYLKKGSAVFILGEMSAPEIYQDRDGASQISLEITAEYIGFNPFGGKDKGANQEGGITQAEEEGAAAFGGSMAGAGQRAMHNGAGSKPAMKNTMLYGSAAGQSSGFEEDDIPF